MLNKVYVVVRTYWYDNTKTVVMAFKEEKDAEDYCNTAKETEKYENSGNNIYFNDYDVEEIELR